MTIDDADLYILSKAAAINRRRLRLVRVSEENLDRWLKGDVAHTTNLPADASVVDIQRDMQNTGCWTFKVWSASWDPLRGNNVIPFVDVMCARATRSE